MLVAPFKFASNLALTLVLIVGHLLRLPYVFVELFPRPLPLLPCMPKPVLSVKKKCSASLPLISSTHLHDVNACIHLVHFLDISDSLLA